MIKLENVEVMGFEAAIRGMRNPMNSWEKSDSHYCNASDCEGCEWSNKPYCVYKQRYGPRVKFYKIGPNDLALMKKLANGGPVHAKYRRMITVYVDITAPLYWWKEFDTYKVGTVANSCSTTHKIADKEFGWDDFSVEHLKDDDVGVMLTDDGYDLGGGHSLYSHNLMYLTIIALNKYREKYIETKDKKYWWQMIQLLPSSYNQKRTVMLNYEVLAGVYPMRKDHKLDEWREFCQWIEELPYSEVIYSESKKWRDIGFEVGKGIRDGLESKNLDMPGSFQKSIDEENLCVGCVYELEWKTSDILKYCNHCWRGLGHPTADDKDYFTERKGE